MNQPVEHKKKIYSFAVKEKTPALEFLAENTKLSKMIIKKLFNAGAIWVIDAKGENRLRKIKGDLEADTRVRVYHDPSIKPFDMELVECIHDTHNWGIWFKPAGLLSQGTKYGDQFSILRLVEKKINRPGLLVHRLDRETSGLMIIAYNKKIARYFSEQIRERKVHKYYQAVLKGELENDTGEIRFDIDGKEAVTEYKVLERKNGQTLVEALLITGKKHQLRIHFDHIGHAIMGDPRYGSFNSHEDGLQLVASKIILLAPGRNNEMKFEISENKKLKIK